MKLLFTLLLVGFTLVLKAQNFKSDYFILNEIIDNRKSKFNTIGDIYTKDIINKTAYSLPESINDYLKAKLKSSFSKLILNVPYQVNLDLSNFSINETIGNDKLVWGKFLFEGQYFLNSLPDSTIIFPFKYSLTYKRTPKQTSQILPIIDSKMHDLNKQLENWFEIYIGTNTKLIRNIRVVAKQETPQKSITDTLYYHQRKLEYSDFQLKDKEKGYSVASILSTFNYTLLPKIVNDTLNLLLSVKVVQIKPHSWITEFEKRQRTLDYLQANFDITQLIAEKFIKKVEKTKLNLSTIDQQIDDIYAFYFNELSAFQNEFEFRTSGGMDLEQQIIWTNKLKNELTKSNK